MRQCLAGRLERDDVAGVVTLRGDLRMDLDTFLSALELAIQKKNDDEAKRRQEQKDVEDARRQREALEAEATRFLSR